ncbi:MAG: DUF503 domain-containing protein [candidate division NC10 bacterium]|nr:DUF503 domain-containing protein [candidate division NC10 bacterium]MCH7897251.1 DUF503 domain-containing protein [candidate division NC10 bacterium]
MVVGTCRLELRMPHTSSLKGKRQILRSIKDRVHSRFNVSIAEVGYLEEWQRATLAVACVSNEAKMVDEMLNKVVNLVEGHGLALLVDYAIEVVVHGDGFA